MNFKPIQQHIDKLIVHLGQPLVTILFVGVVTILLAILFLILLCLLSRCRKKSSTMLAKEEYNLMESKEGMAAKLNLARAYIDMGKETQAHIMLNEVLVNGSPSEQAEAKEFLERIKK